MPNVFPVVDRSASDKDIRAAYKRLSKKYHPDKNKAADAEDRFVLIARGKCIQLHTESPQAYLEFASI